MVVNVGGLDPRVAQLARLFDHLGWADATLARALTAPTVPSLAIREYAHIAGAEETWLSRIEHRASTAAIWPELSAAEATALCARTGETFGKLIARCNDATLDAPVKYTNSAGKSFATPLGDILTHVAMHSQYHRGKVNLLLRESGLEPAPVDFITFVRGVPAATQKDAATARL
jgi:uncharacterized damage-inducible protein DinB